MSQHGPVFDQALAAFTVEDLCHPTRLVDTIKAKLELLPPGRFVHVRLEHGIRLILSMIQDAACGGYRRLPLTALADFLRTLDYFLKWRDRRPDTWEGGYVDDLEEVLRTLAAHQSVVSDYQLWRTRQGESPLPARPRPAPTPSAAPTRARADLEPPLEPAELTAGDGLVEILPPASDR